MTRLRGPKLRFFSVTLVGDESQFDPIGEGWRWPDRGHWDFPDEPCALFATPVVGDGEFEHLDHNAAWVEWHDAHYGDVRPPSNSETVRVLRKNVGCG